MSWLNDREALLSQVRAQMHEKRYQHTLGVAGTARQLALQYGADPDKAELAGFCTTTANAGRLKGCVTFSFVTISPPTF